MRPPVTLRHALLPCVVGAALCVPALSAQSIGVRLGASAPLQADPGAAVAVPLVVDLTEAAPLDLASVQGTITWNTLRLRYDSARAEAASGFILTTNEGNTAAGELAFSAYDEAALAATGTLFTLYFTALLSEAGSELGLHLTAAGTEAGQQALPLLRPRSLPVCVAGRGVWGDVTNDGAVNVLDAQQVARFSVGLSVLAPQTMALRADVTADGQINVLDAQQVARHSVGLAAAPRVAAARYTAPAVTALAVAPSGTPSVTVGNLLRLSATPSSLGGTELTGCQPVTWASSDTTIAIVDDHGLVTTRAPGTVTITATSGAVSTPRTVAVTPLAAPAPTTVVTREVHSCGLATTGSAWCWGYNNYGQLGAGLVGGLDYGGGVDEPVAVSGGLTFTTLAAGTYHTCGLTTTGAAYCWGWNGVGQLGNGGTAEQNVPVAVQGGLSFTAIGAGFGFSCGLTSGGAVYCWGQNNSGQLGDGTATTQTTPVRVQGTNVFAQLAVGGYHACGITTAGVALCWGNNGLATLGDGTTTNRSSPTAVTGGRLFSSISASHRNSCGMSGGQAFCWGSNTWGQVGDGTVTTNRSTPTAVTGTTPFTAVTSGYDRGCAWTAEGEAWCWGRSNHGQLGDGTQTNSATPVRVQATLPMALIAAGGTQHSCALATTGAVHCWGSYGYGQLGLGQVLVLTPTQVVGAPEFTRLVGEYFLTCGQTASLEVSCWGNRTSWVPSVRSTYSGWNSLAVGNGWACGIAPDTGVTSCVGANSLGQLGNGTNTSSTSTPVVVSGGHQFTQVSAYYTHACAVDTAGVVRCWGANERSQLGDGTTTHRNVPTQVSGTLPAFSAVSASIGGSCALAVTGEAWCWGEGYTPVPTMVSGSAAYVKVVAAYGGIGCGLTATGQVDCWGSPFGASVTTIAGLPALTDLTANEGSFCGLTADGAAWCWGDNGFGTLGTGDLVSRWTTATPVSTALRFRTLGGAYRGMCGVALDGTLHCWGRNGSYEAGQPPPSTPLPINGGLTFRVP